MIQKIFYVNLILIKINTSLSLSDSSILNPRILLGAEDMITRYGKKRKEVRGQS